MFESKNFNNLTLVLLGITTAALSASVVFFAVNSKKLTISYKEMQNTPSSISIPMIALNKTAYLQDEYQKLLAYIPKETGISISVKNKIIVTSNSVSDESKWLKTISDLMAMDSNLRVTKMCASVNQTCGDNALIAELTGEKTKVELAISN